MISYRLSDKFKNLQLFTTTREGGVSSGNYSSFNLSPYSGDQPGFVSQNLKILAGKIDVNPANIIIPYQTHGAEIRKIDTAFLSLSDSEKSALLSGVDALITDVRGVCLAVTTADCVPVFLFDPIKQIVAVIHAGWRGTCSKIVASAIDAMQQNFDSLPADIYAVIGPSVSGTVYNVGDELLDAFSAAGFPVDEIFQRRSGSLYLDLWMANKWLMLESGLDSEKIEIAGRCTYTESDTFFSARKLGIASGRMLSGIVLQ